MIRSKNAYEVSVIGHGRTVKMTVEDNFNATKFVIELSPWDAQEIGKELQSIGAGIEEVHF